MIRSRFALAIILTIIAFVTVAAENERVIKLITDKDGGLKTADGSPLYGTRFTFDGAEVKRGGQGLSADFRSTIFDFSERPKEKRTITFGMVFRDNVPIYYISMNLENTGVAFYDIDHNLLDNATRKIEKDGPFADIKLTFTAKQRSSDHKLLVEVLIDKIVIAQTHSKIDEKPRLRLSNLSKRIVLVRVTDLTTGEIKDTPLGLPVLGGRPGIINYFSVEINL